MKKIGILTFHRVNNYGAILQAYALKFILQNKLNHNVKIINYVSPHMVYYSKRYNFIPKKIKLLLQVLVNLKSFKRLKYYLSVEFFKFRFLIDTPKIKIEKINKLSKQYDVFITGSDQVFNPHLTDFDKNFFLDFVKDKNKCFSYAASFGLNYENLTDKEKMFIKQNLNNFSSLSLREKQGEDIVNNLSSIKTNVHIDPTLLLSYDEWLPISKNIKEEKFVLIYLMDTNNKIMEYAKMLALNKNLKIKIIKKVSPQEWLGYFMKAKYIITNSFHGLAFSINFNKNFFVDFIPTNQRNSRLENLLDLTNLRNRLIDNIGTDYDKPIDWDSVNKIVEIEREKSISYLKEITK